MIRQTAKLKPPPNIPRIQYHTLSLTFTIGNMTYLSSRLQHRIRRKIAEQVVSYWAKHDKIDSIPDDADFSGPSSTDEFVDSVRS